MKNWIVLIVLVVLLLAVAYLAPVAVIQTKNVKALRVDCKAKQEAIDTLIRRKQSLFNVQFNVADNSKNTFKWQRNQGAINYTQEKTYWLKIDSISLKSVK